MTHKVLSLIVGFRLTLAGVALVMLGAAGAVGHAADSAASSASTPTAATQKVVRIRAGSSEAFTDSSGNVWQGALGFEGGHTIDRDPSTVIANTRDRGLYLAELYSMNSFSLPLPSGRYTVKLHFAETYDGITGPGQRVFSFNVQGKEFKDFDIWVKAGGPKTAYIETVPVELANGTLKITFTPQVHNPVIQAIEIYPADAKPVLRIAAGRTTPYKDSQGNIWEADRGFDGGATVERPELNITGTTEPGLYRAERYSMNSYTFKVANGTYLVKLHFSEDFDGNQSPNDRIFTFDVQGQKFTDFSPWKKAGAQFKAYIETVKDVKVTDGQIKITFTPQAENPMVNAIEIHPVAAAGEVHPAVAVEGRPATAKPLLRMVAGRTTPFKDSQGNIWEGEKGFEGGQTIERDPNLAIANTKDPGLFTSEHYSMDAFSCAVPNGKYTARLYFAEAFDGITGPGERVFSFNVQGKEFKNFDIWVKAGGFCKAYVESVPVEVADGKFKITFTPNIENPMINAIELWPADANR